MKLCNFCKLEKSKSLFRARHNQCKSCQSVKQQLYYKDHKSYYSEYNSQYFQDNKKDINEHQKINQKIKRKINPNFRLRQNISNTINKTIKKSNSSKNTSISRYLPYTIQELKEHLENLFEQWMTWDNYGIYDVSSWDDNNQSTWTWNIDHIVPQSQFSYSNMEDVSFKECWSLENLRPYSAKQNRLDGDKR